MAKTREKMEYYNCDIVDGCLIVILYVLSFNAYLNYYKLDIRLAKLHDCERRFMKEIRDNSPIVVKNLIGMFSVGCFLVASRYLYWMINRMSYTRYGEQHLLWAICILACVFLSCQMMRFIIRIAIRDSHIRIDSFFIEKFCKEDCTHRECAKMANEIMNCKPETKNVYEFRSIKNLS